MIFDKRIYKTSGYFRLADLFVAIFLASFTIYVINELANIVILFVFDGMSRFLRSILAILAPAAFVLTGWLSVSRKKKEVKREVGLVYEVYGRLYVIFVVATGLLSWAASMIVAEIITTRYIDVFSVGEEPSRMIGFVYPLTIMALIVCLEWVYCIRDRNLQEWPTDRSPS